MATTRTRKSRKNPHYGFLVLEGSRRATKAPVKGESKFESISLAASVRHSKKADSLAQLQTKPAVKKDIVKSLILISLILILELVVYLAWTKFMVK